MRKKYFYVAAMFLLFFLLFFSYCFYSNSHARKYEGGIFVELPQERYEKWELKA